LGHAEYDMEIGLETISEKLPDFVVGDGFFVENFLGLFFKRGDDALFFLR